MLYKCHFLTETERRTFYDSSKPRKVIEMDFFFCFHWNFCCKRKREHDFT